VDSQRLFLYMGLLFICLIIYQAWIVDYGPRPEPRVTTGDATNAGAAADPSQLNRINTDAAATDLPAGNSDVSSATPTATDTTASTSTESNSKETRIKVKTDLVDATLSSVGGTILGVDLLDYPVSLEQPDTPFTLASDTSQRFLVAQSGFLALDEGVQAPTHKAEYKTEADSYEFGDDSDTLVVPMVWESGDGLRVTKTLTFTRGSYEIQVNYQVENGSEKPWRVNQYQQLQRKPVTSDETSRFLYTYIGGVVSTPEGLMAGGLR